MFKHTVRVASEEDVDSIRALVNEAYSPYIARMGMPPGPMLDDYRKLVRSGAVHVAEDADGICGVVVVIIEGDSALLDNVAVANRVRGKAVGRSLIAFAEQVARGAGCRSIRLYTHVTMTENLALYPRLGFVETHRAHEKGYDRVYMAKALSDQGADAYR
jgi:N-acetylglutamate synthase-like GNAT family acetyltransferase